MKLFFFIGDMYPGGAERQLVHLCNVLCDRGWQVTLITLKDGEAYQEDLDSRINRRVLPSANPPTLIWELFQLLQGQKPLVLVNFLFHATFLGRLAARLSGVPCISSYRNISCGRSSRDALMRLSTWLDTETTSNVAGARGKLFPTHRRRELHVIPNMYLGDNSAPCSGEVLFRQEQNDTFNWCFLGRLQPQKNLFSLLLAFKQLLDRYSIPMHLSIAGDGREADALQKEVIALGLSDQVTLLGHISKPEKLLQSTDALVLPSHWEGMPNVLMEAMAAGKPCVATPVGAVPEMLDNGMRGVVSQGTAPEDIAESMELLMTMPAADLQAMVVRAQHYITHECNVDKIVDQWENLFIQAMRSSGG